MEPSNWKVLAIIFMIITFLLIGVFAWAYLSTVNDNKELNICYYEICQDYPEAYLVDGVCSCYDYDVIGNLVVAKQTYMG